MIPLGYFYQQARAISPSLSQNEPATKRSLLQKQGRSGGLQPLVALAVIATALLDPFQTAIGIGFLVGFVLIDTGVHAGLAGAFVGIFRIHGRWEYRVADRHRGGRSRFRLFRHLFGRGRRCSRWRGGRRRSGIRSALGLTEVIPLLAIQG